MNSCGIDNVLAEVQKSGWARLTSDDSVSATLELRLREIAEKLGVPIGGRDTKVLVEVLKPVPRTGAKPCSLSQLHSTGEFPLHADTAHWPTPCRYIILGCVNPGDSDRATILLNASVLPFTDDELSLLKTEPFRVSNGRKSFFATIRSNRSEYFRIDPGCMQPTSSRGYEALALLSHDRWSHSATRFVWTKGDILIIDNWRTVHGRESASTPDSNRELLRILVK